MKTGKVDSSNVPFATKGEVVLESTYVAELCENAIDKLAETITAFQRRRSNWRFASVVKLKINSFRYVPLKGKFYIKQPAKLANKKAFINMKDEDDQCSKWTVTRALNPVDRDGGTNHKSVEGASRKAQLEWNRVPSRLERHRQV